ncbi:MAG: glutamate racemase [Pseudomonadota bacterium]|nr:glutamate racemase [Pseudomonadota bacterium]
MSPENPIAVFDSGVGGLSVLREIRQLLPHEDLLYVADSAHVPYGEKSREFIESRAIAITEFFIHQQAKAVVVACNTATSAAVETLRARFNLPIIAMEPAIKPAAQQTRSNVVGVLATSGTLSGERFANLSVRHGNGIKIVVQPCPGWVELVESGNISNDAAQALVSRYVTPLLEKGADTLVLGCTHYPFLRDLIQTIANTNASTNAATDVTIIDPSPAVARELQRRLQHHHLLNPHDEIAGRETFWTSGAPAQVAKIVSQLWGKKITVKRLPADDL